MSIRPVPLDLKDGKPRLLKFEVDGIILFEEKFERPIVDIVGMVPNMKLAILLLWGALLWQEPTLTLDEVKALYNDFHDRTGDSYLTLLPALIEALARALVKQHPRPNGHDEAQGPNVQSETEQAQVAPSPTGSET